MRFKGGTANLLIKDLDTSIDYNNIFGAPSQNLQDVYRLYNANTGEHFYTLNFAEKTNLQNVGWRYEGIGWLSSSTGSPVYRVYNPNTRGGDHYYTMSKYEAQQLVSKGWRWDNNGGATFTQTVPKISMLPTIQMLLQDHTTTPQIPMNKTTSSD